MVLIITGVLTARKVSKRWEIVTCTYTDVHKESNARYVVVNLVMKKSIGNMFKKSIDVSLVTGVILQQLQRAY